MVPIVFLMFARYIRNYLEFKFKSGVALPIGATRVQHLVITLIKQVTVPKQEIFPKTFFFQLHLRCTCFSPSQQLRYVS